MSRRFFIGAAFPGGIGGGRRLRDVFGGAFDEYLVLEPAVGEDGGVVGEGFGIGEGVCLAHAPEGGSLRGLDCSVGGTVDGLGEGAEAVFEVAEGVGHGYGWNGAVGVAGGGADATDYGLGDEGTGAVVDEDGRSGGNGSGDGGKSVFDGLPSGGASGDGDGGGEAGAVAGVSEEGAPVVEVGGGEDDDQEVFLRGLGEGSDAMADDGDSFEGEELLGDCGAEAASASGGDDDRYAADFAGIHHGWFSLRQNY